MPYTTFCMILGISFWVLAALGTVALIAWVYTQIQYYNWDREKLAKETFEICVESAVKKAIKSLDDFDPAKADEEQYGWNDDEEKDESNC